MNYVTDLITKGTKRRSGILMKKAYFTVAHDTGNDGSTARNNVDYFKRTAKDVYASAHIFVDDKEAIMCVPAFENAEIAYHVKRDVTTDNEEFGVDAIDGAIGVELCYFSNDYDRSLKAYSIYVNTLVHLSIFHNYPLSQIQSHQALDPTRRTDPNNALKYIDKSFEILKLDMQKEYDRIMGESNNQNGLIMSEWAKESQKFVIENGISDGSRPKDFVTREEQWVMLKRLYDKLK